MNVDNTSLNIGQRSQKRPRIPISITSFIISKDGLVREESSNSLGVVEDRSLWTPNDRYYFEDGNVVILAENTLFRVHRSVLALNSEVFKDMFGIPQSATASTVDGAPLLRVLDPMYQISWMLETLYEGGRTRLLDSSKSLSVASLCDLLRIAGKYQIPHVCKRGIKRLLCMFPLGVESWCSLEDNMEEADLFFEEGKRDAEQLAMVVDIIRIFDHLTPILPLVFYAYCQLPVDQIAMPNSDAECSLSAADTRLCLQALPELLKHKSRIFSTFTDRRIFRGCENRSVCGACLLSIVNSGMNSKSDTIESPTAHNSCWHTLQKGWYKLCQPCKDAAETEMDKRREVAYNDLGRIFKVASWPVDHNSQILADSDSDSDSEA